MGKALVGIDVGSKELTVAIEPPAGGTEVLTISNHAAGHRKLLRRLTRRHREARVCLEASGIYGFELACALHRAAGTEVMIANPKAVSDFAGAFLKRSKTDALDAEVLLEFARRMPFVPWRPPCSQVVELRTIARRIEALVNMKTQEKNRRHAARRYGEISDVVQQDIEHNLEHLQQRIQRLRGQALELIHTDEGLRRRLRRLRSIPGINYASGIQILAEIAFLPGDMTVRQWVAHAGLDPRHFESGTSVQKPAHISKRGNMHLRRALFMPALVAIQWNPNVAAFYEKLLDRGKAKLQAVVAVMRKLLHAIYGMLLHDQDFNGEKFYRLPA